AVTTPLGEQWILTLVDLPSGVGRQREVLPAEPHLLRFNWQGDGVAVSIPSRQQVVVISLTEGQTSQTLEFGEDVYAVDWHPDGEWLAVGRGFDVELRPLTSREQSGYVLSGHRWMIHDLMFHPQGRLLLSR